MNIPFSILRMVLDVTLRLSCVGRIALVVAICLSFCEWGGDYIVGYTCRWGI